MSDIVKYSVGEKVLVSLVNGPVVGNFRGMLDSKTAIIVIDCSQWKIDIADLSKL